MRIANGNGRLKLLVAGGAVDVEVASDGRFGADPQAAYPRFAELRDWASTVSHPAEAFSPETAGPPSPGPRQVFAIGLNYRDHAAESGFGAPEVPVVFPKYVSSFAGPVTEVVLPDGSVDWEVEVVAVIGKTARSVTVDRGWDYVAGLTSGQDLSERELQRRGPAPQFGLAKSFPGFSPMGPALVTPDELDRPGDLGLGCEVNGEVMQQSRTTEMIFSIPELVSYLSGIVTLLPGDVIYTGTPPGVGMGRTPPRYLREGDHLHSWVEGLGELSQHFVRAPTTTD
jgi:2-keto-4-pentenoate hydratase/2-oxohepta-3-ene-1,7-dioic acid hydratase in catechol pathway